MQFANKNKHPLRITCDFIWDKDKYAKREKTRNRRVVVLDSDQSRQQFKYRISQISIANLTYNDCFRCLIHELLYLLLAILPCCL